MPYSHIHAIGLTNGYIASDNVSNAAIKAIGLLVVPSAVVAEISVPVGVETNHESNRHVTGIETPLKTTDTMGSFANPGTRQTTFHAKLVS